MRVLWVVKGLGPGGAERLLVAAARAHRSDDTTIECAYVLPWKDHLVGELERADVRTRCLSVRRRDLRWPFRLAELVRSGDYDVVHVHSPLPGSVARMAVRSMPAADRPGLVSTEHNRWETHRLPTRFLNRFTSRWDDASIAVTDEVRGSMRGPARDRVVTVRHGIDVDEVAGHRAARAEVRDELGLPDDDIVVGTVANFRPQKDYPNLLAAADELGRRGVPIRIVAVGQGPQEAAIRAEHERLGLGDRFVLTGFRSDAVRVMAACDVFVLASRWEGLPVAVMEATALGLPIVATDVGGMAEELTDGEDALLVPPADHLALADALERVVTDGDLRERLADASGARAADFSIHRAVGLIEPVYRGVARRRPPTETSTPAPSSTSVRSGHDVRPARPGDRDEIIDLLGRSLGSDGDPRYRSLFEWKHDENHFGPSPMWVATDRGRVVAFRAFMRWEFVRGDHVVRAARAVDTATDPDYRGQGLFRSLTMHGLDQLRADGVDLIFNTPNDQSRPGYLSMGWREVGRIPVAVRFTGPAGAVSAIRSRAPARRWSAPLDLGSTVEEWLGGGGVGDRWPVARDVRELRTAIDESFLRWRYGWPPLRYRVVDDGDAAIIVRARDRGRARELAFVSAFGSPPACDRLAGRVARDAGCSYVIRIGGTRMSTGLVPLPGGGPMLTWRGVNDPGCPPLANWALTLGDIELF